MFEKYRVITMTKNIEGGETTFKEEVDTEKKAMDKFYYNCNSYGTNPSTMTCQVVVFDTMGNIIKDERIDNSKYTEPSAE